MVFVFRLHPKQLNLAAGGSEELLASNGAAEVEHGGRGSLIHHVGCS